MGKPVDWLPKWLRIQAAAFSSDGKKLITLKSGERGRNPLDFMRVKQTLQHWEVGTGRLLHQVEFERSEAATHFEAFSSDGKVLLGNDLDNKLRLRDAGSGKVLLQIEPDLSSFSQTPFCLSTNGKRLAAEGYDGLRLYDAGNGKEIHHFKLEGDHPAWLGLSNPALSPDGRTLAASTPTSLRIWDGDSGELKREFEDCRGPVAFTADGKYLACGDRHAIRLWEADSLREVRRFAQHYDQIRALAFSADGRLLASGQEHTVGLWDVATGKQLNRLPGHHGIVYSLAFATNGLASGADDGAALVWDLKTASPRHRFEGHYHAAVSLAFSPDGSVLATGDGWPNWCRGSYEAQIRLWDLAQGRFQRQFTGHLCSIASLAFSPDGKRLASGGDDARARVWDPASGKRLYQIRGVDGRWFVVYSRDGDRLLIGNTAGELSLYQAESGKKLPDVTSGGLRVSNTQSGSLARSFLLKSCYPLNAGNVFPGHAFSPDGSTGATVAADSETIQLWDLASGKLLTTVRGHQGWVTALAFSVDGKTLASGSRDTTILLWDVPGARVLGLWNQLGGDRDKSAQAIKALAMNPQGAITFLKERLRQTAAREAPYARLIADLDADRFDVREKASRRLEETGPAARFALELALEGNPSAEVQSRVNRALATLNKKMEEQALALIAELDSDNGEEARRRLEAIGPSAIPTLQRALASPPFPGGTRDPGDERLSPRTLQLVRLAREKLQASPSSSPPQAVWRSLLILEQIGTPEARQVIQELAAGPAESRLTREAKTALVRLQKRR